jgi:hypothetical protein
LWAPPVEDPPFASFEWGTDARRDASRRWWGLNVIKNGASGPRLVVDWKKGGIFLPLGIPLDQGKPHCRSDLLGVELPPILDQDAPIIYSSNRRQNAAVYVANSQAQNAPGAIREPPSAATRIETTYRDQGGRDRDVHVFIDSESFGNSPEARTISVSVQKNPELTVGISELADLVDADQMGAIQRTFRGQGFTVELATLAEFAGQDALKELFWAEGFWSNFWLWRWQRICKSTQGIQPYRIRATHRGKLTRWLARRRHLYANGLHWLDRRPLILCFPIFSTLGYVFLPRRGSSACWVVLRSFF